MRPINPSAPVTKFSYLFTNEINDINHLSNFNIIFIMLNLINF